MKEASTVPPPSPLPRDTDVRDAEWLKDNSASMDPPAVLSSTWMGRLDILKWSDKRGPRHRIDYMADGRLDTSG